MNLRPIFPVLAALAVVTGARAADEELDEVILACNRLRAAFLEDAPADVASSMKTVLADECERIRDEPPRTEAGQAIDATWLCGGESLRFFREVLLDGTKVEAGFICDGTDFEGAVFLAPDMIEHQHCVWVSYDHDSKQHDLDLDVQLPNTVE
jgi:hypothetical protein